MTGFICSSELKSTDTKNYHISVTEHYEGYDDSIRYYVNVLSWETAEDIVDDEYNSLYDAIKAYRQLVKQYAA